MPAAARVLSMSGFRPDNLFRDCEIKETALWRAIILVGPVQRGNNRCGSSANQQRLSKERL